MSLEELLFIYQINHNIIGFRHDGRDDPRIKEIIQARKSAIPPLVLGDVDTLFKSAGESFINYNEKYQEYEYLEEWIVDKKFTDHNVDDGFLEKSNMSVDRKLQIALRMDSILPEYSEDILKYVEYSDSTVDFLIKDQKMDFAIKLWKSAHPSARMSVESLVNLFLKQNFGWYIIRNLEAIVMPDKYYSIIDSVFLPDGFSANDGNVEKVMSIDDSILSLSKKADLLTRYGYSYYIFKYWTTFKNLDQNKLAKSIIRKDGGYEVISNITKFDLLDTDIIQMIFTEEPAQWSWLRYLKNTAYTLTTNTAKVVLSSFYNSEKGIYNEYQLDEMEKNLEIFENPSEVKELLSKCKNKR